MGTLGMHDLKGELKSLAIADLDQRRQRLSAVELGNEICAEFPLRTIFQAQSPAFINAKLRISSRFVSIYVISANKPETMGMLTDIFPQGKSNRDYCLPRINAHHCGTGTLYVGSSEKTHLRLKEHLWRGARQTYALHLNRWCEALPGSLIVRVQPILQSADRQTRQDLEDALWRKLKPIYGRNGSR
jgi:hypothetical protein